MLALASKGKWGREGGRGAVGHDAGGCGEGAGCGVIAFVWCTQWSIQVLELFAR